MMKVQTYLTFKGDCQNALNYYADIFDAKIINKQTYQNSKRDIPENYRNNIEHAELKGKGIHIMAYDASPDTPLTSGNNVQMSIDIDNTHKAKDIFSKLSKEGTIHHKFKVTDWNAMYGRCTDKYNIQWMVNSKL